MKSIVAGAPDGTQWSVRVVWEPRWRALARRVGGWRRKRKQRRQGPDVGDVVDGTTKVADVATSGGGGGGGGGLFDNELAIAVVVIFIGVIAAAAMFWWVLLPLLLLVLDLLIVLILLSLAVVGRVLFRRPWTVEATAANGERITAEVVGWYAALRRRDEMAEQLRLGQRPATAVVSA